MDNKLFDKKPIANSDNLITVFIPTYNRLVLLKRAVQSVINCGVKVNLHILDNCSIDGTSEWLAQLIVNSPIPIQITKHKKNIGSLENYAHAFKSVNTPYFVPLADDDQLVPGFLIDALDIFKKNPGIISVIGCTASGDSKQWHSTCWDDKRSKGYVDPNKHMVEFLKLGHYISWSAILWRSEPLIDKDIYSKAKNFGLHSDVYFQFAAFLTHPVFIHPIPAATFAQTENQESYRVGLSPESIADFGRLIKEMKINIADSNLEISKSVLNEGFVHTINRWAVFIKFNREKACKKNINIYLLRSLLTYLFNFYLIIGTKNFPFGEELKNIYKKPYKKFKYILSNYR